MQNIEQIKINSFNKEQYQSDVRDNFLKQANENLTKLFSRPEIGFTKVPDRQELWDDCKKLSESYINKIDRIVVIGIGGSSLGAKVFCDLLLSENNSTKKVDFLDSVDPLYVNSVLNSIDSSKTLFVPISKSGNTIETLITIDYIKQKFTDLNFVVITENKNSPLNDWAKK